MTLSDYEEHDWDCATARARGMPNECFTTIEYDSSQSSRRPWRSASSLYIPVVDEEDRRHLVCQLNMDAVGLNNGWVDTMPIQVTMTSTFVDADDPRNSNPPQEVSQEDFE